MEEKPWLKSEYFAWHDGRRIVDLYELSKQMQCKQCRSLLDLRRTEREARFGLASVLYIACQCGVMNDIHTGRKQETGSETANGSGGGGNMYEINIKASINLLMYGVGASRFLSFLALLDIPVPPPDDTSLIVPVTEDSEMQCPVTSAPASSALPPVSVTPAYNAASVCIVPLAVSNIPPTGHSVPPSSQTVQKPAGSQLLQTVPSSTNAVSAATDNTLPPETASSSRMSTTNSGITERLREHLQSKSLSSTSGDGQAAGFVLPLVEYDSDTDKTFRIIEVQPSPARSKSSAPRGRSRRGRGRPRKTPTATQTSASTRKKKRDKSSDEDGFVNPLELPCSASESDTDGTDSDSDGSWSDEGKTTKQKMTKRKSGNDSDSSWHASDHGLEEDEGESKEDDDEADESEDLKGEDKEAKGKRGRKSGGAAGTAKRRRASNTDEKDNAPKCPVCSKIFSSISSYKQHMKQVHGKEVKGRSRPLTKREKDCELLREAVQVDPWSHKRHIKLMDGWKAVASAITWSGNNTVKHLRIRINKLLERHEAKLTRSQTSTNEPSETPLREGRGRPPKRKTRAPHTVTRTRSASENNPEKDSDKVSVEDRGTNEKKQDKESSVQAEEESEGKKEEGSGENNSDLALTFDALCAVALEKRKQGDDEVMQQWMLRMMRKELSLIKRKGKPRESEDVADEPEAPSEDEGYICPVCKERFAGAEEEQALEHFSGHVADNPDTCLECHHVYSSCTELAHHLRVHVMRPGKCNRQCDICGMVNAC